MGLTADRVKVSTTTTGTGAYTIVDVPATGGFRTFAQAISAGDIASGDTVEYCVADGTNFEVNAGVYTSGSFNLTRATIRASSNAGAAVNWGAGTKDVWLNFPAIKANNPTKYELFASYTETGSHATIAFTGINAEDVLIKNIGLAGDGSGAITLAVSINNGSGYSSTQGMDATAPVAGNSYSAIWMTGLKAGAVSVSSPPGSSSVPGTSCNNSGSGKQAFFQPGGSPINAIRLGIADGSNYTSGTVEIWVRR